MKKNENEFAVSDKEILTECEAFYKKLYSSKIQADSIPLDTDHFFQENDTVLNKEESDSIEGLLTDAECIAALKDMGKGKSPGNDGLPSEFYKTFWSDISEPLLKALNYGFEIGQLSVSQRRGFIKLIPKKSEELYYIRNWRPLTLLNCDYKIAAKAIANRLKTHLPKLINNDQSGFIKGRFIGENIRLIDSVINYAATKNIPGKEEVICKEHNFNWQNSKKLRSKTREEFLTGNHQTRKTKTPFVVTYHPGLPNLSKILRDLHPVLQSSNRCKKAIKDVPLIAFRKPKSLGDYLVQRFRELAPKCRPEPLYHPAILHDPLKDKVLKYTNLGHIVKSQPDL
ncbi:hypothetical protein ACROYT_G012604 [Oculina patagonica]